MNKKEIIKNTAKYVRKKLGGEDTGHDWWHVYRVWRSAVNIGKQEKADLFVVQLAALLHDIADWKFHSGDGSIGPKKAREWLKKLNVDEDIVLHVSEIIKNISFKGLDVKLEVRTKEGQIVQDADRLDALGAIGIARAFAYHAEKHREIYNPDIGLDKRVRDFRRQNSYTSIHHFYDKILYLKNLMNTRVAKKMAQDRHEFTKLYLKRFFEEWEGKI